MDMVLQPNNGPPSLPPFFGGRFYRAIETHYTCVCVCVMRAALAECVRLLTKKRFFLLSFLNWLQHI